MQRELSDLYGSDKSYYLVNGSTTGVLVAISAVVPIGGKLLVARNCHKSVYHAAYLRNIELVYCFPTWDSDVGVMEPITESRYKML